MPHDWYPPGDLSGGYFIAEYTNAAGSTHRAKIHVLEFNIATGAYSAPPGSETHVSDTIAAWFQKWKVFYTSAWTISLISVWHNNTDGTFSPMLPPPVITPVVGTNAGAESVSLAGESIFNSKTSVGGRFKIVFIAPATWDLAPPVYGSSSSGGNLGTLWTYLTSVNCAIVGHDNGKPINYVKLTTVENRRLRRHFQLN